jgi:hypothetical protein
MIMSWQEFLKAMMPVICIVGGAIVLATVCVCSIMRGLPPVRCRRKTRAERRAAEDGRRLPMIDVHAPMPRVSPPRVAGRGW